MKVNDRIVLDDNQRYTLLEETELDNETYFLAMALDEKNKPIVDKMVILKECQDIDGIYVETVGNESLIIKLTRIFERKLNEEDKEK